MTKQFLNCLILSSCVFNGVALAETSVDANSNAAEKKFRIALSADAYFYDIVDLGVHPEIRPEFRKNQWIVRGTVGGFISPEGDPFLSYGLGAGYSFERSEMLSIDAVLDFKMIYIFPVLRASVAARYALNESADAELSIGTSILGDALIPTLGLGLGYAF